MAEKKFFKTDHLTDSPNKTKNPLDIKDLPKAVLPMTYEDCRDRWLDLKMFVFEAQDKEFQIGTNDFDAGVAMDLTERFEQDMELRQSVCEVLLACTLWIESGRQCKSLLKKYVREIRGLLGYGANVFLEFLQLRSAVQKQVVVSRGSLEDAWIHLFAEFRDELTGNSTIRWWKRQQLRYGAWQ